MTRYIFIGDIHGCIAELRELLDRIAPGPADRVVSVGDIVDKGPDPRACIELWMEHGYLAVRGNAEEKLLRRRDQAIDELGEEGTTWIERLPLQLVFPEIDVLTIHGGLFPDMKPTAEEIERNRDAVLKLRFVRWSDDLWIRVPRGEEKEGDRFWSTLWEGPPLVVYGHHPTQAPEPRLDRMAIGLDTGCVYGGALSAVVFEQSGGYDLVSVPARRSYFGVS